MAATTPATSDRVRPQHLAVLALVALLLVPASCSKKSPQEPIVVPDTPTCTKPPSGRVDARTPESVVADWGTPVRLGDAINSPCPQDASEISRDGLTLYFMFTTDLMDSLPAGEILHRPNGTYAAGRLGGPGEFDTPRYIDLGQGTDASLDGAPSFTADGGIVYFHSARGANTGNQQVPPVADILDLYVADISGGVPGPGTNLGTPVNSTALDGEPAIHPDGVTLYFASTRSGATHIWSTVRSGAAWSAPVMLPWPVNSAATDNQPAFTADGDTLYFVSTRNPLIGSAIFRVHRDSPVDPWTGPELVMRGIVGEPSLTADGRLLYFVHVRSDAGGNFDTDVWYSARTP